ncbi:MAG TPA: glycosyltransferase [Vicinamibacterales bacterium]|nr:glycosyltransferase [Vicinamibacterales bacterium]
MIRGRLRVLTYHRILPPDRARACNPGTISATPEGFERQMRYLAARRRVVSADQVIAAQNGGPPLRPGAVLITFDDACRDFRDVAWPILKRHGLPAVVFVPTAFPDRPEAGFWWDRLYQAISRTRERVLDDARFGRLALGTPAERRASLRVVQRVIKATPHAEAMREVDRLCRALGEASIPTADVLSWDELRALAAEGVTCGAHTRTHPALTQLPIAEARAEIEQSRDDLTRQLGRTPRVFAYPFGDHDARVARLVWDAGFDLAVTCLDGSNPWPSADPWRLRRTNITRRTTPVIFRVRLTEWGAYVDRWRHRGDLPAARPATDAGRPAGRETPKVAYIMSRFPKLSETFILNEMSALASLGARPEVYPLIRERCRVAHPEVQDWVRRAHYLPLLSWRLLRAHAHFAFRQPSTYLAVWSEVLRRTWGSLNFFIGALGTVPKAIGFAHEMQAAGIEHVHAHFATHPAVAALVIHRLTNIPFSFTAHGSDLHVDRRMLDAKVEGARFVVAISGFNREVIVRECGEHVRSKVEVVHCGVDTDVFRPRRGGKRREPFQIVCVASFEEVKGHTYLIEACRLLRERSIDFQCHLVGDGPMRREIERQIARDGLGERICLHGPQARPEVLRLLWRAHVGVLASHPTKSGKREGIPVALMEAMACELPVVATAISGIPELIGSGVEGLLVPSGDPLALAHALACLHADRGLCERMGRAGRLKVLREFDLHENAARLLSRFAASSPASRPAAADPVSVAV